MVPRVRISSVERESDLRATAVWPVPVGPVVSIEGVGVSEREDEPDDEAEDFLNCRRRLSDRGLGHVDAVGSDESGRGDGEGRSAAFVGRAAATMTGEDPTEETGEYSLGVAVRGVEAAEAEAEEDVEIVLLA